MYLEATRCYGLPSCPSYLLPSTKKVTFASLLLLPTHAQAPISAVDALGPTWPAYAGRGRKSICTATHRVA